MTITQRKRTLLPDEVQAVSEPGLQITCDSCNCDLTHSIRIKCADAVCDAEEGIDICPSCFCAGKEFKQHKRGHAYRVVELHSYPIFSEDWGADEELLLIEGISSQGLGNWQAVAEHVGTRTKEEVEQHYHSVYINSMSWPLPRRDLSFDVDPSLFHERKRRRISSMGNTASGPKPAPTSAPGVHEVATFLPGRLEFEHELDNEAEDLVKDLEFGVVTDYEGDRIPIDPEDVDVVARAKLEEERRRARIGGTIGNLGMNGREMSTDGMDVMTSVVNGYDLANGHAETRREKLVKEEGQENQGDAGDTEEPVLPPPYETRDSIDFKLALLEMYNQRVEKRLEAKAIMFDRNLTEYRKMQMQEKKRQKEEREFVQRLKPLAKLQTGQDFEDFVEGIIWESTLRKKIQELQHYRRMGLTTAQDIERYESDLLRRTQAKTQISQGHVDRLHMRQGSRASTGPDARRMSVASFGESETGGQVEAPIRPNAPGSGASLFRKQPAPLNLVNAPSLHLLTPAEQALCSTIRIRPKPYLIVKETLVREYARRGGKLRRREARDLVKIDVNKTSRIWDFLHQAGYLRPSLDMKDVHSMETPTPSVNGNSSGTPSLQPPPPVLPGQPAQSVSPQPIFQFNPSQSVFNGKPLPPFTFPQSVS